MEQKEVEQNQKKRNIIGIRKIGKKETEVEKIG